MQFRLLGPVEVHTSDGHALTLPRRQERCLLAILLLEAGRVVSIDRLIDLLWEDSPPPRPHQALRSYVSHIRSMLGRAAAAQHGIELTSHRGGYILKVDPDAVDAHRFRRLLDQAARTADPQHRDRLLRQALALWRGPALDKAASDRLRQRLCADLDEHRLQAIEASIAAGLDLGRHRELLPELARLGAEHQTRERLVELHMLALYQDGRTAEALDTYNRTRIRLSDELGLDPSPHLQQLHQAILRGEPVPTPAQAPARTAAMPTQLPMDLPSFIGRADHLQQLDGLLVATNRATTATAIVITAIDGTAGVGKTTLAVHWAHRVADRFPDGQLYVNLRGFDPAGMVMDPAEAMRRFLDALDVPAERIPTDLDAQAALYRSQLAGRHILIVLDNARDTTQVRPLLPGVPTCLVLVTSRNSLTGLVATTGAHPIMLDLLPRAEARQMLAHRIGADRTRAEPEAVEDIITGCARLPLALAIMAARAATQPNLPLTTLATELREARDRFGALTGDDPQSDIRAVFSWSYRALTADAARLFRLLGLHPGPDIETAAAASLTAVPPERVRPLLEELVGARLILEHRTGRYTFHDLLRAYAADLTRTTDRDDERRAATHRMLDHYLHSAHAADRLLYPQRDPISPAPPQPGVTVERLANKEQAMAWLTAEHPVLVAAVEQARSAGLDEYTKTLAWTLGTFLDRRGHWHDWLTTQQAALEAARRLGDVPGEALAHRNLAGAYSELSRLADARRHLRHALDLHRRLGDRTGQAHTHHTLSRVLELGGNHQEALEHSEQALELHRAVGHRPGQAYALNNVGWYHALLGDHEQALSTCQQALALHQELGDPVGQAAAWDSLGYAHHHLAHHEQAVTCYEQALDLFRGLGDRYEQAATLAHLGDTNMAAGRPNAARDAWRQAADILTDLDHPDADKLRIRLLELDRGAKPG